MSLPDAVIYSRAIKAADLAGSGTEPGEAILILCRAIAVISRSAQLSDYGTRAAVDSAMHHMLPR
jgi:hypothetical protein